MCHNSPGKQFRTDGNHISSSLHSSLAVKGIFCFPRRFCWDYSRVNFIVDSLFPSKETWKKITVLLNTISAKNSCRIPLGIFCKWGILIYQRKISLGQSLSLLEESIYLSHAKFMTGSLIEDYAIPNWVSIMTRQLGKHGALKAGSRSFTELKIVRFELP